MKRTRVLLADDHVLIAQALKHLLQAEFDVVGTVVGRTRPAEGCRRTAARRRRRRHRDAAAQRPRRGRAAQGASSRHQVVFLTQNREPRFAVEAFRRQASGLSPERFGRIRVDDGHPRRGQGQDLYLARDCPKHGRRSCRQRRRVRIALRDLSPREREVLQLLAEGKSMKEVAACSTSAREPSIPQVPHHGAAARPHERGAGPASHQARSDRPVKAASADLSVLQDCQFCEWRPRGVCRRLRVVRVLVIEDDRKVAALRSGAASSRKAMRSTCSTRALVPASRRWPSTTMRWCST